jgi:hypothetical protein
MEFGSFTGECLEEIRGEATGANFPKARSDEGAYPGLKGMDGNR